MEDGKDIWAVKVKAGRHIAPPDLSGLTAFGERVRACKRKIVVFQGLRKQRHKGIECIALLEFLNELPQ